MTCEGVGTDSIGRQDTDETLEIISKIGLFEGANLFFGVRIYSLEVIDNERAIKRNRKEEREERRGVSARFV